MAGSLRTLSTVYRNLFLPPLTRSKYIGRQRLTETGFFRIGFQDPQVLKSYDQIQDERNPKDPEVDRVVNIGFGTSETRRELRQRQKQQSAIIKKARNDPSLERAARLRTLKVPLNEVEKDWAKSDASREICNAALHYGVFQDLFGAAYFFPQVPLDISFATEDDQVMPVFRGNLISPEDAKGAPNVNFSSSGDSLWTLVLSNLDGHIQNSGSEYVHWFIGNISGNDLKSGEELLSYMQPLPMRGTGFHRYVFVLFKQNGKIDFSAFKRPSPCYDLQSRTFHMPSFYRGYQDVLTPAGLAFFLSEWDSSVTDCFHKTLDAPEPAFEYEHRPLEHPRQRRFPKGRQPFNLYLDRYRDKREIAEEMVRKRLKTLNPFKPDPPRLRWPLAQKAYDNFYPTWKVIELKKEQLGHARYKLLYNPWAKWGGVN